MTGKGDTGQLGLGHSVKMCHEPTPLPLTTGIKFIAAGIAHSGIHTSQRYTIICYTTAVLITYDGCVCTFGSGTGGQLGLGGTKDVYQVYPVHPTCIQLVLLSFFKQPSMIVAHFHDGRSHEVITSAAAGVDHTLFLNNKGLAILKLCQTVKSV